MRTFFAENDLISVSTSILSSVRFKNCDCRTMFMLLAWLVLFVLLFNSCCFSTVQAEVQKLHHDGQVSLHTRNLKYGKLTGGVFLAVPSSLIKRQKQHFQSLACGVDVILGCNGYIWITETPSEFEESYGVESLASTALGGQDVKPKRVQVTEEGRERVARVRNCIQVLANMFIAIYPATILDVYLASVSLGLSAKNILNPEVAQQVTQTALERKQAANVL